MKKSKIVASLLTLLFMLTSVCFIQPEGSEVMANDSSNAFYIETGLDISDYKQKNADGTITSLVPKATGRYADWIFAGWYKDSNCTSTVSNKTVEGTAYAKFVPAEVLSIKCQTNANIASTDDTAKIRIISTVDSLKYSQVGFDLQFKEKEISYQTSTVLSGIEAAKDGVKYDFSPNIFDLQSKYFITATVVNIQNEDFDEGLLMKPYWITKDGTKVYGIERYARVEDSYLNIVNVPVRLISDDVKATGGTVTVTYDNTKLKFETTYTGTIKDAVQTTTPGFVTGGAFTVTAEDTTTEGATKGTVTVTASATEAVSTDGMFAHLRFELKNDEVVLPKRNEFKVTSAFDDAAGVQAVDSVYHYYHSAYTGKADTDWFEGEHAQDKTEFVITSPDELYGLADLVNKGTFVEQKIYLGSDITINSGLATEWASGNNTTGLEQWFPIGTNSNHFIGEFDGCGHTISGLYYSGTTNDQSNWRMGLFGVVTEATITNVKLENSFIAAGTYIGSFVGVSYNATMTHLYSDAIIRAEYGGDDSGNAGGIVGDIVDGGTLTDCWFAGDIASGAYGKTGGLVGRMVNKGDVVIKNCLNSGIVSSTGERVGGFIGYIQGGTNNNPNVTMTECLNIGSVSSTKTASIGAGIGKFEAILYVDKNSVHTVQSGLTYSIGTGFTGTLYDINGNKITSNQNKYVPFIDIANITGDKAYQNTGLDYENVWVARQASTPVLSKWCDSGAIYKYDTDWAGAGTETDPYIIKTANELYGLAKRVNEGNKYAGTYFALGANITVNSGTASRWEDDAPKYTWIPIGANTENNTKYNFQGTFDGQGYSIKGLYFCDKSATYSSWRVGLFGSTQNATIRDVRILNSTIQGGAFVGAFVGHAENTNFADLYTDTIVKAIHSQGHAGEAGGIVGKLTTGKIDNCWNAGDVTSGTYGHLGGILGVASGTEIVMSNCLNTGDVTGSGIRIGGFLGCIAESSNCIVKLSESLNLGNVSRTDSDKNVGSAVGQLPGNTHLWVDQPSVRTVSSNLTYAIGTGFSGYVYNLSGGDKQQNNNYILTVDANAIQGVAGYTETKLTFDRPETKDKVEGAWATTKVHPILVSFADVLGSEAETVNTQIAGVFRADTKWFNNVKVETQEDGSTIDTYTLNTPEDLYGFAKLVNAGNTFANKKVYLGEDIVLHTSNAKSWSATETIQQWTPIGANATNNTTYNFQGTFDGQGHSISGVYFSDTSKGYSCWRVGLFGSVKNATITNVRLLNSMVQGGGYVGAFAGYAENTNFTNLYSETDVNAYYSDGRAGEAGGIVGLLQNGEINNCWNAGSVASGKYGRTGGIVGSVYNNVVMSSCLNTGDVSSTKDFGASTNEVCYYVGGFAGYMADGCVLKLSDSLNMGSVSSAADAKSVGAAVGTVRTGTTLYVEKESVHTILAGSVASTGRTIGSQFSGGVYNFAGVIQTNNNTSNILSVEANNINGVNGYTNTGLAFDRPETTDVVEGTWITTSSHPILGTFIDLFEEDEYAWNKEMQGQFRADTAWATVVTDETLKNEFTNNEYIIDRPEELYGFAKLVNTGNTFANKEVFLGSDIVIHTGDAKSWNETETLQQWTPIGANADNTANISFKGTFDGKGHSISGLYFADTTYGYTGWRVGLFGSVNGATIENVKLLNSSIQGGGYVGSFVGYATSAQFTNLYSNATLKAIYSNGHAGEVGGIVGLLQGGTLSDCTNDGNVMAGRYGRVGGILGVASTNAVVLSNCLNTGSVTSVNAYGSNQSDICICVGGLLGRLENNATKLTISNSWNDGDITAGVDTTSGKYVGGLVGFIGSTETVIEYSLNSGNIHFGDQQVGGLIGTINNGKTTTITECLNVGNITTDHPQGVKNQNAGSVIGYQLDGAVNATNVFGYAGNGIGFSGGQNSTYVGDGKDTPIQATNISYIDGVYDISLAEEFSAENWTFRVDDHPIPTVFFSGDSTNEAVKSTAYPLDLAFEGEGTEESPYQISTAAELYGLALLSQKNSYTGVVFELTDNITVNPVTIDTSVADGTYYDWLPIGNSTYPFAGTLKGNGFTISGLYKAREAEGDLGLFARTTADAVIEDFTLTNTYFHWLNGTSDAARMGAIVGRGGGTFTDIHSSAVVTSSWYGSGGIVGEANSNTTITNCWFDGAVKGLRADGSSYTGGMIGLASGGEIAIKHSLVSGSASAWKNVGGFIGGAKGTIQVTLEDNLFSGTILDGASGYAGQFIGSVEGASTTTSATITKCFGVSDDVAEDIGVLASSPSITGKAGSSVKADRLIGYTGTANGLDYTTYWVLTKNSTPGLKTFTAAEDIYDGTGIDALLQLTYWDKTLANAEDKGSGNYMVTVDNAVLGETDGSTAKSYYGYLTALAANGFTAYGNDNGLNSEGVYNAIYTKGTEWVVNVTYISYKENDNVTPKIYITFNTGQPLSKHLKAADVASVNYSATDGYSVAQDKVIYHMLESSYAGFGAGSYVMQLKDGHFVVIDGGILDDVAYLFEYLESLVAEGTKPIVEAWIFSHQHSDHMGPVLGIMQNVDAYKDRIYVEGFYYNEPNGDLVETYAKDSYSLVQALKNCAANVLITTEGQAPQIYRIQTGQRYTFDGVEMDIMLSQELLTLADYEATFDTNNSYQQDSFNDTSTWCMFTIGEGADAQKLLSSGDGSYSEKKYVCDMYSSSYMTVDVFTALHHGLNTNMSQYMVLSNKYESVNQEAFSQKCTVEGVVLYSYKYDMTQENQTLNNNNTYAVNWKYAKLNDSFITYLEGKSTTFANGIPVLKNGSTTNRNYLYFGEGASVLTFHGKTSTNPITAEVLPNYDFTE